MRHGFKEEEKKEPIYGYCAHSFGRLCVSVNVNGKHAHILKYYVLRILIDDSYVARPPIRMRNPEKEEPKKKR